MTSVSEAVRSENLVKPVVTESDERRLNTHELTEYRKIYDILPDEHSNVIFVATKVVASDSSGTLYAIDAYITRGRGESYREWWLSDIAMAYLQQQHTVLVLSRAMMTDMLDCNTEEVEPWLQIISLQLETFGHDFAKLLGAQTGCYVGSWPLVSSSSPLPKGGLE